MQITFDFVVIVVSVLLGVGIFYAVLCRWEHAKKSIYYTLLFVVVLIGFGVGAHAYKQSVWHGKIHEFQKAFNESETLVCLHNEKEIHVHKSQFLYFDEMLTFSGKDSQKGVNVPIMSCTQHVTTNDSDFINE